MNNQSSTLDPFSTKPKEAPKNRPIGGAMGYFDGETESEQPLDTKPTAPESFYEAFKEAPFQLLDPSGGFESKPEFDMQAGIQGTIDFNEYNRKTGEEARIIELQTSFTQKVEHEIPATTTGAESIPEQLEENGVDTFTPPAEFLPRSRTIFEALDFKEFFAISRNLITKKTFTKDTGKAAIEGAVIENLKAIFGFGEKKRPTEKDPKKIEAERKKQLQNRNKGTFFANLRDITRGINSDVKRMLDGKRKGLNQTIGVSSAYEGSLDQRTGEVRIDLEILAEKKNSEMKETELKAKKEAQMAAVAGKKDLKMHLGAQEGNSMVANQIMTAG